MKKSSIILLACLAVLGISVLAKLMPLIHFEWGSESKSSEESIETMNYKKACESKDFSTAYEIVDKLKEKTSEAKVEWEKWIRDNDEESFHARSSRVEFEAALEKSEEAEKYVVLQESLTVLESEGSKGLMRIVGIAKEHNAEDWLYPELLDVANKIGDTDLAERIQNIIEPESMIDRDE